MARPMVATGSAAGGRPRVGCWKPPPSGKTPPVPREPKGQIHPCSASAPEFVLNILQFAPELWAKHVLEYVWKAAWSFFEPGDPDAETWVAA